jgi:hypothetical protein
VVDAWKQLHSDQYEWQLRPGWLILACALHLVGLLPAAVFWRRVLAVLGQEARFWETLRAYYVGHLGKYVPGKAMVVIIRTGLIRGRRVDTSVAAVSVFVETLTMMAVGACLAAAVLAIWLRDQGVLFYGSIGLAVVAGLPTLPPVFRRLVRLVGVGKSDPAIGEKIGRLDFRTLMTGWLLSTLAWCLLGMSYWATLRAMGIPDLNLFRDLPLYTAGVSFSTVVGFLLLVLPAGLLVREAALAELMIPYYFEPRLPAHAQVAALASVALLRLAQVVAELSISAALYWRRRGRS